MFDLTPNEQVVIALKGAHEDSWQDRSQWYWFWRLLGEVNELFLSLIGVHDHVPNSELTQIAAIAMNWLEKREDHTWRKPR